MNFVIFCIRSLRDKLHIAQSCLQRKSRKLPGRQAKPGTSVQKVPFALQELAAWAEQIKCQERVMFLFLSLSVWCWRFMDPFILLISVRLHAINIRTSTNCLQDLNLRLNVGFIWSHGREALLQLHSVCMPAFEHVKAFTSCNTNFTDHLVSTEAVATTWGWGH